MTLDIARTLKVGDQVRWLTDNMEGTIVEVDYVGVKVHWADQQWAIFMFRDLHETPWHNLEKL